MSNVSFADSTVETLEQLLAENKEPQWLHAVRHKAFERFQNMDWPKPDDEEFRRSSVNSYAFEKYAFELGHVGTAAVYDEDGKEKAAGKLVFEGAEMRSSWLSAAAKAQGVLLLSFQDASEMVLPDTIISRIEETMMRGLQKAENRLSAWHYTAVTHGAIVYVPRSVSLSDAVIIDCYEDYMKDAYLVRVPHVVIVVEEGADCTVVYRTQSRNDGEVLFNEGVSMSLHENAGLRFLSVQNVNINSSCINNSVACVHSDARLETCFSVFGGMFNKYRFDAEMLGKNSEAFLGGAFFPVKDQHVDLRTVQHHSAPHTQSRALYKGVIADEAHSVYQGLIQVEHDALNTDAYLTNNNLLLSDEARADSIPTLNISTNEVRCSHGATTGKLDAKQLFYLQSRGCSPEEARYLLIEGFFESMASRYPDDIAREIRAIVHGRIRKE